MAGFPHIAYTPAVRQAQIHYGGRAMEGRPEEVLLGAGESAFIETRDGFYMATVNADGWPYVQFRGGPPGFLRVLDETTVAWADFRGNRQYVTVGNLSDSSRLSMILMDYSERRRLKLFATATVVDAETDPALAQQLVVPGYGGRVERLIKAKVAAFDWNCPQHIVQRWTREEWERRSQSKQSDPRLRERKLQDEG